VNTRLISLRSVWAVFFTTTILVAAGSGCRTRQVIPTSGVGAQKDTELVNEDLLFRDPINLREYYRDRFMAGVIAGEPRTEFVVRRWKDVVGGDDLIILLGNVLKTWGETETAYSCSRGVYDLALVHKPLRGEWLMLVIRESFSGDRGITTHGFSTEKAYAAAVKAGEDVFKFQLRHAVRYAAHGWMRASDISRHVEIFGTTIPEAELKLILSRDDVAVQFQTDLGPEQAILSSHNIANMRRFLKDAVKDDRN
jgi:hypothetical protein